jgi:hypothetical protein
MRTVFDPEGDIRSTDLLASLVALWREGTTGSLQFQRSGATAGFDLAAGEIVGASSSDPRFDTAAILVRAGKLEASTLDRLSASEGMDRAMTALQAGVLTRREWRWGEKIRAVEVLSDLLTWIDGDYTFFRTAAREAGEFRLTIPRLVLELFLRSRDRGLVLHHLGGVDVPLVRDSRFDAEFSTFGLTDDAESVVRLIDGESTAAQISSEAPADTFAVEKLLAALVTLGLVHPAYATPESDSAARPTPPPPPAPREKPEYGAREAEFEATPEELDAEELEPEVDIEEREVPTPDEAADAREEDEFAPSGRETEELVDAPLESTGPEYDSDEASERLATDLEAHPPIPGDLMEPAPSGAGGPTAFDRPLDLTTGVGSLERPKPRSTSPLLWVLVLLAAVVAGVLYWRARGPASSAEPSAAAPSPGPTLAVESVLIGPAETAVPPPEPAAAAAAAGATKRGPTIAPTRPAPTAVPTLAAARAAPTRRAPTALPTRRPPTPAPTKRAAAPAPSKPAPAAAPGRSRKAWLDRAERDQRSAAADSDARFAIQLELACEVPSLTEAWAHDRPAGSMWVITTSFKGRTCFKVLWGRYATREEAARALESAPAFFSTPRNHPMVVAIR